MLRFMVNMKTSLAAQRAEMFKEQGFKNMFVKVFYKNLTISQQKWQPLPFFPKNTLIYHKKPSPCNK